MKKLIQLTAIAISTAISFGYWSLSAFSQNPPTTREAVQQGSVPSIFLPFSVNLRRSHQTAHSVQLMVISGKALVLKLENQGSEKLELPVEITATLNDGAKLSGRLTEINVVKNTISLERDDRQSTLEWQAVLRLEFKQNNRSGSGGSGGGGRGSGAVVESTQERIVPLKFNWP
ncbi:hypothetical protein [Roseofilum casamattae]|uniref:Uncharacterized protein n=1 Tax=Roseofilum casamattae BLCC-M143 TaxID=3022442 RepID=A0ABT7BZZ4_9CYAN|nr:hypothetical protein [Roseofilum casamattae]MDJ1183818.1 hypothetical protein [Roseofilum casamattae BLCC-M143]